MLQTGSKVTITNSLPGYEALNGRTGKLEKIVDSRHYYVRLFHPDGLPGMRLILRQDQVVEDK